MTYGRVLSSNFEGIFDSLWRFVSYKLGEIFRLINLCLKQSQQKCNNVTVRTSLLDVTESLLNFCK